MDTVSASTNTTVRVVHVNEATLTDNGTSYTSGGVTASGSGVNLTMWKPALPNNLGRANQPPITIDSQEHQELR
ncbi:MAG: hypothetical protein OEM52_11235 [bacterium]|nr:hypothetical protein [bacterium]